MAETERTGQRGLMLGMGGGKHRKRGRERKEGRKKKIRQNNISLYLQGSG